MLLTALSATLIISMRVISFFLVAIVFASCKTEGNKVDDSEVRYKYYNIEKTGWKSREHVQDVDDIIFKATEVPIAYYILKSEGNKNLLAIDSIEKANQNERILEFIFTQGDKQNLLDDKFTGLDPDEVVKYMSFSIADDFFVVTSKNDTIKCSGVLYERNFNITAEQKLMLFFTGIGPAEKIQLVYDDKLFKKGTLKFKFEETTTNQLL